jgi:hypothetical protein
MEQLRQLREYTAEELQTIQHELDVSYLMGFRTSITRGTTGEAEVNIIDEDAGDNNHIEMRELIEGLFGYFQDLFSTDTSEDDIPILFYNILTGAETNIDAEILRIVEPIQTFPKVLEYIGDSSEATATGNSARIKEWWTENISGVREVYDELTQLRMEQIANKFCSALVFKDLDVGRRVIDKKPRRRSKSMNHPQFCLAIVELNIAVLNSAKSKARYASFLTEARRARAQLVNDIKAGIPINLNKFDGNLRNAIIGFFNNEQLSIGLPYADGNLHLKLPHDWANIDPQFDGPCLQAVNARRETFEAKLLQQANAALSNAAKSLFVQERPA